MGLRWLLRYGLPLVLMTAGWWLWHLGAAVPGAPLVILGRCVAAVAVGRGGNLYVVDGESRDSLKSHRNHRIWKVSRWSKLEWIAGSGQEGYSGDGGPAVKARLDWLGAFAADSEGSLYIADEGNHRIRKVDRTGTITTIAGNGQQGESGDGGFATKVMLDLPSAIALDAQENLYFADALRIRRVNKAGIITTVAGNGEWGCSGDGGQAVKARLKDPESIALDVQGNLYIADGDCHSVRKVDRAGIITTIAGSGREGYGGDGGPAVKARLAFPAGITCDTEGNLYIADMLNNRIRKVDKAGMITTVAGNEHEGYSGDRGQAVKARLESPTGIVCDVEGSLYIVDGFCRIRKVDKAGIITTVIADKGRLSR